MGEMAGSVQSVSPHLPRPNFIPCGSSGSRKRPCMSPLPSLVRAHVHRHARRRSEYERCARRHGMASQPGLPLASLTGLDDNACTSFPPSSARSSAVRDAWRATVGPSPILCDVLQLFPIPSREIVYFVSQPRPRCDSLTSLEEERRERIASQERKFNAWAITRTTT